MRHTTILQRIADVIARCEDFTITTHSNLDGDALAAEAALAEALAQLGKRVSVINSDPVPSQYKFLRGSDSFLTYGADEHDELVSKSDAVILVDAARPDRTGRLTRVIADFGGTTVAIDHHPNGGWAQVDLIDSSASAAAELVDDLIAFLPVRLTPSMAEALYAGIVDDTQGFRTPNTTPDSHRRAARLLEAGASMTRVHDALFASRTLGRLRLQGHYLLGLRSAASGRIIWGVLRQSDLRRWRQTPADAEGFVDLALRIEGTDMAILMREEEGNAVRLSFRSRGTTRVDGLAQALGGGGHPQAAGATVEGPLDDAARRVLRAAANSLATGAS